MSAILSEIERIKQAETVATFAANEAAMLERLGIIPPPLGDAEKPLLTIFVEWCALRQVRYCPARPAAIATFALERYQALGAKVFDILRAIESLHDLHGFSNPVATAVVSAVLNSMITTDPPRSWPKEDKALFALLPPKTQITIAERERQRDTALRRAQNETAKKGSDTMAKQQGWQKGEGPYSKNDVELSRPKPDSDKPRDISERVERNQTDSGNTALK